MGQTKTGGGAGFGLWAVLCRLLFSTHGNPWRVLSQGMTRCDFRGEGMKTGCDAKESIPIKQAVRHSTNSDFSQYSWCHGRGTQNVNDSLHV